MKITLQGNLTTVEAIPAEIMPNIRVALTWVYQEFDRNNNMMETIRKSLYRETPSGSILSGRGASAVVRDIAVHAGVPFETQYIPPKNMPQVDLNFPMEELRDYQLNLIKQAGTLPSVLIQAPTGSGKTFTTIGLIASRQVPTLIIVNRKVLLDQWRNELSIMLDIPKDQIGEVGDGKLNIQPLITVAIDKSLAIALKDNRKAFTHFNQIVADECHGCAPGGLFAKCVTSLTPRYAVGLSATPKIKNSLVPCQVLFGRNVVAPGRKELTEMGFLMPYEVKTIPYNKDYVDPTSVSASDYTMQLGFLVVDHERNALIVEEVKKALTRDRGGYDGITLVLCTRKSQIATFEKLLTAAGIDHSIIQGCITSKERQRIYAEMKSRKSNRVLIGQIAIVGAGLDLPRLDTLIIATPFKQEGVHRQAIGRIIRSDKAGGKRRPSLVVDIQDNGVFSGGSRARRNFYRDDSIE